MTPIDVQVNSHIGLGPLLLLPKALYSPSQRYEQSMIASGHLFIMGV